MKVAAVILAAGAGARVGSPKALLRIGSESFVERVVATARRAGVARSIVVVGYQADRVEAAVPKAADVALVRNSQPERGQLSSLKVGIEAAMKTGIEAGGEAGGVLVWPVDHPAVRVSSVEQILSEAAAHPGAVVVARRGGNGGHPAYFSREFCREVLAFDGAGGARGLLEQRCDIVRTLEIDDPGLHRDVDTPDDYSELEKSES